MAHLPSLPEHFITALMANTALCSCRCNPTFCHYNQKKLLKLSWPDHILAAKSRRGEYTPVSKGLVDCSLLGRHFSSTCTDNVTCCCQLLPSMQRPALKTHLLSWARAVTRPPLNLPVLSKKQCFKVKNVDISYSGENLQLSFSPDLFHSPLPLHGTPGSKALVLIKQHVQPLNAGAASHSSWSNIALSSSAAQLG